MRIPAVMVLIVSLSAGGCAPRAKPVGYIGGGALTVAGMAMIVGSLSADCEPENALGALLVTGACRSAAATGAMFGFLTMMTGAAIVVGAAASSPSAPEPGHPEALSPLPSAMPPGAAPSHEPPRYEGPWPARPPSRSPSAPSGSPLAFD